MGRRDVVAIGTSAGGLEALRLLASGLPADLPAAVLVVIHLSARFDSALDAILADAGPLAASFAKDGEPLRHGHVFIAPPACHLLLERDHVRLGRGPRENNFRPAIDPMFRSVAACCGPRAIGVVLTGTLGDGATGLRALQRCGGITAVQDPDDAAFSEMPANALRALRPDHVAPLRDMPGLLARLVREPAGPPVPADRIRLALARRPLRPRESWARDVRQAEEEVKMLRDSMRRIDEIAARDAGRARPDEVSAARRKRAP
jgi:two-component system chemotaxis response regulator CheB